MCDHRQKYVSIIYCMQHVKTNVTKDEQESTDIHSEVWHVLVYTIQHSYLLIIAWHLDVVMIIETIN